MKTATILIATLFLLSACNTFQGMGRDIKSAGEALSGTAEKTKEEITK